MSARLKRIFAEGELPELPSDMSTLDRGAARFLAWRATRAGVTPQAYLDAVHAERSIATERETTVEAAVAEVRRARGGGIR